MKKIISIFISLVIAFSFTGCGSKSVNTLGTDVIQPESTEETQTDKTQQNTSSAQPNEAQTTAINGQLKVHYIDVGQADSILVQQGGQNMLIDAGNNADSNTVVNYLKRQGVSKVDVLIGTHPHEDHIGGMDAVIKSFDIGIVYMPKVTSTTQTFKDVVTAMNAKGLKATIPVPGNTFKLGGSACTILAPNGSGYGDLNNYSIVLKLVYGSNKFIFEGDAEGISENQILNKGFDISADVIKIGHHGSNSSSTQTYINHVKPKYAVISAGKGNSYGHPHQKTMTLLKDMGIPIYRTDEAGTIICTSDGKNISFNCNPGSYAAGSGGGGSGSSSRSAGRGRSSSSSGSSTVIIPPTSGSGSAAAQNKEVIVYVTNTGKKYHRDGCRCLSKSRIPISLSDAKNSGYSPCSVCNPPQ